MIIFLWVVELVTAAYNIPTVYRFDKLVSGIDGPICKYPETVAVPSL